MERGTASDVGLAKRVWVSAVRVTDFKRALEFYRDLLGFPVQLDAREFNWMEVGPEEPLCKIGLSVQEWEKGEGGITRTGIVLEVDDMDAFATRLKEGGVRFTDEPTEQPWGGVTANFLDPDGNELQAVYDPGHYEQGLADSN